MAKKLTHKTKKRGGARENCGRKRYLVGDKLVTRTVRLRPQTINDIAVIAKKEARRPSEVYRDCIERRARRGPAKRS